MEKEIPFLMKSLNIDEKQAKKYVKRYFELKKKH